MPVEGCSLAALRQAYEFAVRSIMVGSGQPFHTLGADAHFCAQRANLRGYQEGVRHDS